MSPPRRYGRGMRSVVAAAMVALALSGSVQASNTVAVIESIDPSLP
ncbi:MAG: hypothetical protein RL330_150, partial [Actinomycetota bacterium]